MFQVVFTKQAERTLRRMPRNVAILIHAKLDQLASDPYGTHHNATKLKNRPAYRLRVGDWRVVYEIHDAELVILVLKIASRGSVYE